MPKKKTSNDTFEKLVLKAIDDALLTLGDSARQSIYFHLKTKYKMTKNDIPFHIRDFADDLEKIFGPGSKFLEIVIMKKLYEKTGSALEWDERKELVFADYVAAAKQSCMKNEH